MTSEAVATAPRGWKASLRSRKTRTAMLNAAPLVAYLLALLVLPILGTLTLSVRDESGALTLHWYVDALTGANAAVLLTTLRIAAETALASLVVGFVLAYALSRLRPLIAGLLMLLVIVPHFISALVRTYGWIILLGEYGLVNSALTAIGMPGAPYQLLYNELGVVIGTTSVMLPYTVLVLYSVMRGVDHRLIAAAASMGAGPLRTFRRVYLPLVAPGIASAGLLSFILSIGYYLTPALMGGERQQVVASVIHQQVMKQSNWNGAAAFAVILLTVTVAALLALAGVRRVGASAREGGRRR